MVEQTFRDLNAELNLWDDNHQVQFQKDKDAARAYFLEHVNQNTVFFHTLEEKTDYLIDNGYWREDIVRRYGQKGLKELFQLAHSFKHRFDSFLGAYKFYTAYALKTNDGKRYLERFEDRVVLTAIEHSTNFDHAKRLVEWIIEGYFQPATPTFLNAGRVAAGGPTSCYLLRVEDNMESINRAWTDAAQLSKRGGGVAFSLSNLREAGAPIKGIEGQSSGVIPVMKVFEDIFSYANQLGARQGAGAVYLHACHPDILKFLDTKRENADEKIRIKTLSLGVVIPDVVFDRLRDPEDDSMYLFSPYDVKKHYGMDFTDFSMTEWYDTFAEDDRIRKSKISSRKLMQTIAEIQFESGYPYIMFDDTVNYFNPSPNIGRISQSNLCYTGDTRILTDKGYRRAIDLYESQEDFNVVVDERARTMNLNNTGTSVQESTKMFKTAEAADIYKLSTVEGFELRATEWHKMYVDRDGELVKIPLSEVEPGDKILVQGAESAAFGDIHKPDEAYLAGLIASDGTYGETPNGSDTVRIDFYGDERQFAEGALKSAWRVLQGREDLLHKHKATLQPKLAESPHSDRASIVSLPLTMALAELGVSKETKFKVPEFVWQGDRETVQAYLNGVWQMDGCIAGSPKVGNISIELDSVNKEFLRELQMLLLELGVYTRICKGRKAGKSLLPDGKGEMKEYHAQQAWSIRAVDRRSRETLHNIVEWKRSTEGYWQWRCSMVKSPHDYSTHKYRATVASIEFDGVEDVYDVTVDNGNSIIVAGQSTGQCSEILQPQTKSTYNSDSSFFEIGRDVACNLGSLNVAQMHKAGGDFATIVADAVEFLSNVSAYGDFRSSPSINEGNSSAHAIGLGQMNLHGFFIEQGVAYDSQEAIDMWREYIQQVTYEAIRHSTALAMVRDSYDGFEGSDWESGSVIGRIIEDCEKNGYGALSREDWEELQADINRFGMYNQNLQAIPPTGSISYINGSTSSIHPIASKIEIRKEGKVGRVYYPAYGLNNDNFDEVRTAYEIGPNPIIDMYAASTPYVDQGQSLTLFFNDNATTKTLNRAHNYAHKRGVKTLYYVRIAQKAIEGTRVEECVSCML